MRAKKIEERIEKAILKSGVDMTMVMEGVSNTVRRIMEVKLKVVIGEMELIRREMEKIGQSIVKSIVKKGKIKRIWLTKRVLQGS